MLHQKLRGPKERNDRNEILRARLRGSIPLTRAALAKYPFLPQAKQYIAALDLNIADLGSLEPIVDRAKERITATFEFEAYFHQQPSKHLDVEIASFPVATLVVAGVQDKTLTERYALSEAKQMFRYLRKEKDDSIILAITEFFEWSIRRSQETPYPYTVHFVNYLASATKGRLVHDSEWKLTNRKVRKGQIYVTRTEVCRLLQEDIRQYVEAKAREKVTQKPPIIQRVIDEIQAEFLKKKPHLVEFDKIVVAEESEYPPCIKTFLDRAIKGQHLSHTERFTLVTYLLHQGVTTDGIINLFSNVTDFRVDKTRYQVEHLAGRKGSGTAYKPYNCATLQTHGACVNPNDPICRAIKNPLRYHVRRKWAEERRKRQQS